MKERENRNHNNRGEGSVCGSNEVPVRKFSQQMDSIHIVCHSSAHSSTKQEKKLPETESFNTHICQDCINEIESSCRVSTSALQSHMKPDVCVPNSLLGMGMKNWPPSFEQLSQIMLGRKPLHPPHLPPAPSRLTFGWESYNLQILWNNHATFYILWNNQPYSLYILD